MRAPGGQIVQRVDRHGQGRKIRRGQRAQVTQHLLPALERRIVHRGRARASPRDPGVSADAVMRRCAASAAALQSQRGRALPAAAGGQLFDRAVQPVEAEPGAETEMRARHDSWRVRASAAISATRSGATRSGSSAARLPARRDGNPCADVASATRQVALAIEAFERGRRDLRQLAQRRLQPRDGGAHLAVLAPVQQQPERVVRQEAAGFEQRIVLVGSP